MNKGWYLLVGLTTLLIVILIGFAAYITYQGSQTMCAPGATACSRLPPGNPEP
jgi:hypothetical protein